MPNFIAEAVSVTITAATASALTCADTSGLYVGQRGWIVDSGGSNNLEIIVVNVADSTHFSCQKLSSIGNSGNADLSSYNGGTCYFEKQLVEVPGGGSDLGTLDTIAVGKVPAKTDTGFANATTANIPASTNKNYVTDAQLTTVSGITTGTYSGNLQITGNLQVDGTTLLQSATTVSGVAKFAEGAVGAPSITFASDLTAGLYHTGTGATGKILAAINGAEALTLTSVGLAIGSSLPDPLTQKLYVKAGNALFNSGYGVVFSNAGSELAGGSFVKNSANNFLQLAGANGVNIQGQLKVGAAAGSGDTPLAAFHVVQAAASSGTPKAILLISGAHTGMTASSEDIGVLFDLSATKTWAAGNIATQREFVINAPTYAFASASTIASAATVYISGAPIAGANATITASAALVVASGNVGIGTTAPDRILTIYDASADYHIKVGYDPTYAWVIGRHHTTGVFTMAYVSGSATPYAALSITPVTANVCVGVVAAGASAARTLVLSNSAVAPSGSADIAHLYCADIAAGRATLATWSEEAPAADVGLASTHSYIEFINGVKYKRMLVAV